MGHHHVTSSDIKIHGDHLDNSKVAKVKLIAAAIAILGTLVSIYLLFWGPQPNPEADVPAKGITQGSYTYSWLFAFYFFLTLSIGGCFWTLLHNVSNSGWGTSVRRTFENLGSTYPWMFLFGIPLLFPSVQHYLYEWMNIHRDVLSHEGVSSFDGSVKRLFGIFGSSSLEEALHHDHQHLLYNKAWYMNLFFWYVRVIFWGVGLSAVIYFLRKLSTDQDIDPNPGTSRLFKARFHSTYTLIIFALTITFTGFDFMMALDFKWFSTMWGVYLFAGSALNSMAVIILVCAWLQAKGHLKNVTTGEHYHIMGKLLFAFTVFWAYISFSQYFLIWYAGITEETSYFLIRNTGNWNYAMMALVFLHFVVPFVVLLQAWLKRSPKALSYLAVYTLCMHVLDHYLITIPERGVSLGNIDPAYGEIAVSIPGAFLGDILAFVTIGAAFLFFLLRAIGQHSLYPNRDPRILESANLSN